MSSLVCGLPKRSRVVGADEYFPFGVLKRNKTIVNEVATITTAGSMIVFRTCNRKTTAAYSKGVALGFL